MTPVRLMAAVGCWLALIAGPGELKAAAFDKGPYLQNVSKTSVTVMWQSDGRRPGKLTLHTTPERVIDSAASEMHEIVLEGLEPATRYRYTVEIGDESSGGEFATAPASGAPISFIVYGDSRSNASAHARVIERIRQEVPDFLIGTGDIVNEGHSEADWAKLFEIEGPLLRETPMFPALGNHDRQGRGRTADNYRKYFAVPENSPDPERYYAFTYGSSRFLILDSNTYSFALTDQTAWIEQQLQAARLDKSIEHIFVTMHHPPYSVSLHGGQSELREAWTPFFEKYQVDAVFSGHDHVYSRAKKNGVNYYVSGGGGAPLYGRKKNSAKIDEEATQFFERVNHHLRVQVVGKHVEVTAVRADGTIIETISWGELPRLDAAQLLALKSRGRPPASMDVAAVGAQQAAPRSPEAATSSSTPARRGFGLLGILGALMTICAGIVGIWAWRS